jgi:hypothetical protein
VAQALDANTDYLLIASRGTQFLSITTQAFTTGSEAVFEFRRGWTVFSVPFNTGKTVGDLFPGRSSDATLYRWDVRRKRYRKMSSTDTLEANQAYGVSAAYAPGIQAVTGDHEATQINLQAGWNFIGPSKTMPVPVDARLGDRIVGFNEQTRRLFRLKAGARLPSWQEPAMLMQRRAYWIYAKEAFTLDLN